MCKSLIYNKAYSVAFCILLNLKSIVLAYFNFMFIVQVCHYQSHSYVCMLCVTKQNLDCNKY